MKKLRYPAAALLAVAAVAAGLALSPTTRAASSLTFEATFDTASDFYDRFDYGFSGIDPANHPGGNVYEFHGDHDTACEGPDTDRTVHFTPDFSEVFWHCAPGGDPAKGHLMTGVDTLGYNIAWFTPKDTFTDVSTVCWDINATAISARKWTQVLFVGPDDATRYPSSRGSGGFDLGYTSPEFRQDDPNTRIFPQGGTLAGLKDTGGTFNWFQNQDNFVMDPNGSGQPIFYGWPGFDAGGDKATRFKHCIQNQPGNRITVTEETTGGLRSFDIPGQIPSGPVKVVFEDDNYDPAKDAGYDPDRLTWHWDDVQIYTGTPNTTTTSTSSSTSTSSTSTSTSTSTPTTTSTTLPADGAVDWRTTTTGFDGWIGTERVFRITLRVGFGKPWRLTSSLGYRPGLSFATLSDAEARAEEDWQAFRTGTGS